MWLLCPALASPLSPTPCLLASACLSHEVVRVLGTPVGLGGAWRRSKLRRCLDKSASYQACYHINSTRQARLCAWAGDLAAGLRHQRWHVRQAGADVGADFDVQSNVLEVQS